MKRLLLLLLLLILIAVSLQSQDIVVNAQGGCTPGLPDGTYYDAGSYPIPNPENGLVIDGVYTGWHAPGSAGDSYEWHFPVGTTIPAGSTIVVHWQCEPDTRAGLFLADTSSALHYIGTQACSVGEINYSHTPSYDVLYVLTIVNSIDTERLRLDGMTIQCNATPTPTRTPYPTDTATPAPANTVTPTPALTPMPSVDYAALSVISVTIPPLETGQLYANLITDTDALLQPIDDFANQIAGMVSEDPVNSANGIVNNVTTLWQYLNYFSVLVPGLLSFSALILFYLLIMLIKVILSVLKYLKQLIAQWV